MNNEQYSNLRMLYSMLFTIGIIVIFFDTTTAQMRIAVLLSFYLYFILVGITYFKGVKQ